MSFGNLKMDLKYLRYIQSIRDENHKVTADGLFYSEYFFDDGRNFMKDYTKSMMVDFKEVDRFLHLKLDAFLQMLNTTSMYHTVSLGLAPDYMEQRGMVWVLYSWNIRLFRGDFYAKKLYFTTFALFHRDIYSHRYFLVKDEEGTLVGYALSVWIVIDFEKRKMVKVPEDVQTVYLSQLEPELTEEQAQIVSILSTAPLKKRRNPQYTHEKEMELRFHDIDSNGHVNNTVYVDWAMESLTTDKNEEFLITHVVEALSIVYKKEKMPGGKVRIHSILEGLNSYHEIYEEDGCLLTLVECQWKKRS